MPQIPSLVRALRAARPPGGAAKPLAETDASEALGGTAGSGGGEGRGGGTNARMEDGSREKRKWRKWMDEHGEEGREGGMVDRKKEKRRAKEKRDGK